MDNYTKNQINNFHKKMDLIKEADFCYENFEPLLEDLEYDKECLELKTEILLFMLENNTRLTKDEEASLLGILEYLNSDRIQILKNFNTRGRVDHVVRMGSLPRTATQASLLNHLTSSYHLNDLDTEEAHVLLEPKYDGIQVSMEYNQHGILEKCLTRGDCVSGYDITELLIKDSDKLPYCINYDKLGVLDEPKAVIRGELIIDFESFEKLKVECSYNYKTPRSALVAIMNQGNVILAMQYFSFIAYEIIILDGDRVVLKDKGDLTSYIKNYHCNRQCWNITLGNLKNIIESNYEGSTELAYNLFGKKYPLDGLVLSTNNDDTVAFKELPRLSKFRTEVREANFRISKKFRELKCSLTVAPITVDYTTFVKVPINDFNLFRDGKIKIGSYINVLLDGGKLVYLETIQPENGTETEIEVPRRCPHCKEYLTVKDDKKFCKNIFCLRGLFAQFKKIDQLLDHELEWEESKEYIFDFELNNLYKYVHAIVNSSEKVRNKFNRIPTRDLLSVLDISGFGDEDYARLALYITPNVRDMQRRIHKDFLIDDNLIYFKKKMVQFYKYHELHSEWLVDYIKLIVGREQG